MLAPVRLPGDVGTCAVEVVYAHVLGLINTRKIICLPSIHEVIRKLGLAVDGDTLAARQAREVDAPASAVGEQLEAVVDEPFAMQALADAGLVEEVDRHLLQHAGTNAAEHVLARLSLEDDGVDAGPMQQLSKQEPGGPCTDDGDLGSHRVSVCVMHCAFAS